MMNQKIFLVGNAHLDVVWLWRWQEGYAEIKATFQSALDRMKEFTGFKFTCGCANYYEWVEKNEPAMFEEIKQRVSEGRWIIVGGWYIQPDCNLPCGEAFVRQGLYSQRYFKEKFGVTAKIGYNVDSFGHNGNLPQILKKSGMDYYIFMRPMKHEKDLPANLFYWEGQDGNRVLTFRIPVAYNSQPNERERLLNILEAARQENIDYMAFYGVGNHGGGATIENIKLIHELSGEYPNTFYLSEPHEYFNYVEEKSLDIPIVLDDLQFHAKGCYSAYAKIKADNRMCEHTILTAEKLSVLSNALFNTKYPLKPLTKAWKNILFNQFHDTLGGCSIKEAYTDAGYLHGEAMSIGEQAINTALQKISWNIDTLGGHEAYMSKEKNWKIWEHHDLGTPAVVFNPLPWQVQANLQLNCKVSYITDNNNSPIPSQQVRASQTNGSDKYNTLFSARVPALGYKVYRLFLHREAEAVFENPFACTENTIENAYVKITFDISSGCIKGYYDKVNGREILSGNSAVAVLMDEEHCDTWAHNITEFKNEAGRFGNAQVKLVEKGPVRAVIRITNYYGHSVLRQDFILNADSSQIEVKAKVDFREKHKMMKLKFAVNAENPKAVCEIPYGYIERPTDGTEQTGQQWICLSDSKNKGITLLNDSKYSFDAEENELSLTILRSAIYADHFGDRDEFCEFMEQGLHEFCYAFSPYTSIEDIQKRAYELNVKPCHIIETFHKGTLPCEMQGIKISADNVIVTSLKLAEDRRGYVLRCFETAGRDTCAEIVVPFLSRKLNLSFSHNEIKTIYLPVYSEKTAFETNLIEE